MKKVVLTTFTLLAITLASQAQTQKDWYLIGGSVSDLGIDFQEDNTAFSFNLTPRVAWFIKDNFALGAEALIGLNTSRGFTSVTYGIGPIARYYMTSRAIPSVKKTRWFLDANAGFNGTNIKVNENAAVNTNGLGIGVGPGLAYFINQNIALEVVPKYNLTVGFGNSTTTHSINLNLGFQIFLPKAKLKSMKDDVNQ